MGNTEKGTIVYCKNNKWYFRKENITDDFKPYYTEEGAFESEEEAITCYMQHVSELQQCSNLPSTKLHNQ